MAINQGVNRSEFTYDGWGKRVRMVEKVSGSTTSDRRFLWCGMEICEERDSLGGTVVKRFFSQGVQETPTSTNLFYATDHLGSVRELTDSAGTIRARYDYDPYGRTTKVSGDKDSDYRYAGLFAHPASGLQLAIYRPYDATAGRWLTEDPGGLDNGLNRAAYVRGSPARSFDPKGLKIYPVVDGPVEESGTCPPGKAACVDTQPSGSGKPCMPRDDGTWGFEVWAKLRIRVRYQMPKDTPNCDTPPDDLETHEGRHVRVWQEAWRETTISKKLTTERFKCYKDCKAAYDAFKRNYQNYYDQTKADSEKFDNPVFSSACY